MAGSVEDGAGEADDGDAFAIVKGVVGGWDLWSRDSEPAGLHVHHFDQGQIVLVIEDGRSGDALEAMGAGDVVDVGVGDDDLADGEVVLVEDAEDARDVVAGIDDDRLEGGFVAQDGTVAL